MHFAIIGDIKSNFLGLCALFDTLDEQGIHLLIHTGNVFGAPENALACLNLLQQRSVISVQGRHDKHIARQRKTRRSDSGSETDREVFRAMDSAAVEYLNRLPRKTALTEEGLRILVSYGALDSPRDILERDTPRSRFERQRELECADVIVLGGAEEPFAFYVGDTFFVCPGLFSLKDNKARYTLVDTESAPYTATFTTLETTPNC